MGANIPGKMREVLGYCGGISTYDKILKDNVRNKFEGFQMSTLEAQKSEKPLSNVSTFIELAQKVQ